MARIASGTHETIKLHKGDMTIFSSRQIPGNEAAISRVQNNLIRQGVTIITDEERPVHVSGHPARDEMSEMYGLVRPKIAIPGMVRPVIWRRMPRWQNPVRCHSNSFRLMVPLSGWPQAKQNRLVW